MPLGLLFSLYCCKSFNPGKVNDTFNSTLILYSLALVSSTWSDENTAPICDHLVNGIFEMTFSYNSPITLSHTLESMR